jgi:hypothetical protein
LKKKKTFSVFVYFEKPDGYQYTAAVTDRRAARRIRKRLLWRLGFRSPWVILAGVILGLAIIAGGVAISFWGAKPSLSTPFNDAPALSATQGQTGGICWTRALINFDGNRSQVWENILDAGTRDQLPFNQFKDDVVIHNPQLKDDGYIFYSQKTYLIPEICH